MRWAAVKTGRLSRWPLSWTRSLKRLNEHRVCRYSKVTASRYSACIQRTHFSFCSLFISTSSNCKTVLPHNLGWWWATELALRQWITYAIPNVLRGGKPSFEAKRRRMIAKYRISSSDELEMRGACFRRVRRELRRIRNECSAAMYGSFSFVMLRTWDPPTSKHANLFLGHCEDWTPTHVSQNFELVWKRSNCIGCWWELGQIRQMFEEIPNMALPWQSERCRIIGNWTTPTMTMTTT
jgi:hypothetical protein